MAAVSEPVSLMGTALRPRMRGGEGAALEEPAAGDEVELAALEGHADAGRIEVGLVIGDNQEGAGVGDVLPPADAQAVDDSGDQPGDEPDGLVEEHATDTASGVSLGESRERVHAGFMRAAVRFGPRAPRTACSRRSTT